MNIHSISIYHISAPLKAPFQTHLETVTEREALVIEVRDHEGRTGYGEAVPFSSPWYTEETIVTCGHILKDFLVPMVLSSALKHPSQLSELWKGIRRNRMAKSGLGQAIWDLYAKQQGVYIGSLFGGTRTEVAAGAVIAAKELERALSQIEDFLETGYKRYKIKISPENDLHYLSEIRKRYPDLTIMADANSAYSLSDLDRLKQLDQFGLQMIEQPLGAEDIVEHSIIQKELNTPICLDESISSFEDAKSAVALGSCKIISVKMSRVGGWTEAARIHDLCIREDIPLWCGGMIEFGISRAHNIALASLKGFTIPGDISSSSKYWEEDIIDPEVVVKNGCIEVPKSAGIGFSVNVKKLADKTLHKEIYSN
ncbi:o-succinylbenzoate synthase [Peribacillus sp. B-H-3]|uniref:o-succinylbenzoate synthase n=1 Tax=Peribacillus sp. B-H-3 TaxID=3400420 RepID=UPI003B0108A0